MAGQLFYESLLALFEWNYDTVNEFHNKPTVFKICDVYYLIRLSDISLKFWAVWFYGQSWPRGNFLISFIYQVSFACVPSWH